MKVARIILKSDSIRNQRAYSPNFENEKHIADEFTYANRLAPANYHLSVELGKTFALSAEEMVNNSRPAIDLLFESGAYVYRKHAMAIVLSGANRDGARGLSAVARMGGLTLVQNPEEAEIVAMPAAALEATNVDLVLDTKGIIECLNRLSTLPQRNSFDKPVPALDPGVPATIRT